MSLSVRKITYKLYPTAAQIARLEDLLRLHKDLWNAALQERIDAWRKVGKSISYEDQCASLTQIRGELPDDWAIMNCSSQQVTLRRLNKAFQGFFRRVAHGQSPGFPRYKSIQRMPGFGYKGHGDGWRFTPAMGQRKGKECWKHGTLRLQGVGKIKARGMARQGGKIKSCELLHSQGEWHLSLTVECADIQRDGGGMAVAADWGVKTLLSLVKSDGTTEAIDNPRWFKDGQERQLELDRAVSRKKRRSKGWRRAKRDSAAFKAKMARQRLNHHHQLSARIAGEVAIFATEDLVIKNMTASAAGTIDEPGKNVAQKSGLNREILDTAPALLMQLIAYKVEETGGQFIEAPTRKLKPSQRCPSCWAVKKKSLSQRVHRCDCGCEMDRDMAAAQVVLRWAMQEQFGQELPKAA
jgi:putative transposase